MKLPLCASFAILAFASVSRGGPVETAIVAAMKLSDQPNYSWTSDIDDDARSYQVAGRIVVGGFTRVSMPAPDELRERLGRNDDRIEAIFYGNVKCMIRTDKGWKKPADLPWPTPDDDPFERARISALVGIAALDPMHHIQSIPRLLPKPAEQRAHRGYSNLQLSINPPHLELGVIVGSHAEFKVDGETVTGTLTDAGAALLLVHDGQKDIVPRRAGGSFTLLIHDGIVVRYRVKLSGVLSVTMPEGTKDIEVQQTMSTVLNDIGTTTVDVPDVVKKKLAR